MKKILCLLLIFSFAVPAFATVTFTLSDTGSEELKIVYTTSGKMAPRGIALDISCTGGAYIQDACDLVYVNPRCNAYVDYFYTDPCAIGTSTDPCDWPPAGTHPFADPCNPGVVNLAGNPSHFTVCLGVLDMSGNQWAGEMGVNKHLVTIKLHKGATASTTVTVSADKYPRAGQSGVVGDIDGVYSGELTTNLPQSKTVAFAPTDCFPGVSTGDPCDPTNPSNSEYDMWVGAGKPDCWCWPAQCYGDADGQTVTTKTGFYTVSFGDYNILSEGWQLADGLSGRSVGIPYSTWVCGDIDHEIVLTKTGYYRNSFSDYNILSWNWQNDNKDPCDPCYVSGGMPGYYGPVSNQDCNTRPNRF